MAKTMCVVEFATLSMIHRYHHSHRHRHRHRRDHPLSSDGWVSSLVWTVGRKALKLASSFWSSSWGPRWGAVGVLVKTESAPWGLVSAQTECLRWGRQLAHSWSWLAVLWARWWALMLAGRWERPSSFCRADDSSRSYTCTCMWVGSTVGGGICSRCHSHSHSPRMKDTPPTLLGPSR